MRLRIKTQQPHVIGNDHCCLCRQQASTMRLRILNPRCTGLIGAWVAPIFTQKHDGRMVMTDLAGRGADRVLEIGHNLVDAGGERLRLAGPHHLCQIIDSRIAYRRVKPHSVADRPYPHHRGIVEIAK